MGILKAFADSLGGSFADQWKDLITCGAFDELTVVAPGILKSQNNGRGENYKSSVDGVLGTIANNMAWSDQYFEVITKYSRTAKFKDKR